MTVAMTQGALNAQNPKTRQAWEQRRAQRSGPKTQTPAQFRRSLAQLAAAFPDNVRIH